MEKRRTVFGSEHGELVGAMPATFAGRYLLECAVAAGDSGVVWRGEELATHTPVALKFFPARAVQEPRVLATGQHLVRSIQQCVDSGVVAPLELAVGGRYAALVSPWVDGPTLRQVLRSRPGGCLEVEEIRHWLGGVLAALEDIHAHGLVHGDLHPGVIFPRSDGVLIIGCESNAWMRRTLHGRAGTPKRSETYVFLSPALRRGEVPTVSDDIYALGALLYEALTGAPPQKPWWRQVPVALERQRRRLGRKGAEIPVNWDRTIRRCLEPLERDRIDSVRALRLRLEVELPTPTRTSARPSTRGGPLRPSPAVVSPEIPRETPPVRAAAEASAVVDRAPIESATAIAEPPAAESPGGEPQPEPQREPPRAELAHDPHAREDVPGVFMLRALLGVVSVLTIGAGAGLVWQIVEKDSADLDLAALRRFWSGRDAARDTPAASDQTRLSSTDDADIPAGATTASDRVQPPALANMSPTAEPDEAGDRARTEATENPNASAGVFNHLDSPTGSATATQAGEGSSDSEVADPAPRTVSSKTDAPVRVSQKLTIRSAEGPSLSGGILELGLVDVPPRVIDAEAPEVPRDVLATVAPARVEVVVVIDRMGRVASASVSAASDRALVEPCLQAARLWRFSPASLRGQAVAVRVAVPLVFEWPQT